MSARSQVPEEMQELGTALRMQRVAADLTGQQLANATGISQSRISRIELGQAMPDMDDITRWLEVTHARPEQRELINSLFESSAVRVVSWRKAARRGLAELQHDVALVEASARTILNFQPVLIPGLLQTADYIRRLILSGYPDGHPDLAAAIQARISRQDVLHDDSKRLEFILSEAALRWRMGPASTMRGQVDRIMNVATLPSVTIGIIPFSAEVTAWHIHGFQIIDDVTEGEPMVRTETLTQGIVVRDAADVERYRQAYRALRDTAVFGQQATDVLAQVMADYR